MCCFASTDSLSCQSLRTLKCIYLLYFRLTLPYWGTEILPYIGYTGMSSLKGYEKYGVGLGHFRLKLGMVFFHSSLELGKFLRSYFFHH